MSSGWLGVWWLGRRTCDSQSWVRLPAMTLPGYFWDRWPSLAGKLSWDITTNQVNSALHPWRHQNEYQLWLEYGRKVTTVGVAGNTVWSLLHGMWFPVAVWRSLITNSYIQLTYHYQITLQRTYLEASLLKLTVLSVQTGGKYGWSGGDPDEEGYLCSATAA